MLASQLSMIKDDWPAFKEQILVGFHNVQIWVTDRFGVMHNEQMDIINKTATKSLDSGTLLLGTALLSLSSLFILLVFTFLYTFFSIDLPQSYC